MKVFCIVQARLTAARLPGKVIKLLGELPIYQHVYNRLCQAKQINKILFAIPDNQNNVALRTALEKSRIPIFLGSELDVLARYYLAAKSLNLDYVVRATCDNPFVDPVTTDQLIQTAINERADYVIMDKMPLGVTTEVVSYQALEKAYYKATEQQDREHVTSYIYTHPSDFKVIYMQPEERFNRPNYRLTIDTPEDYEFASRLYDIVGKANLEPSLSELIQIMDHGDI